VDHEITVELKNEVCIRGTLKSVDQYLNIKLDNAEATDEHRWPHLVRPIYHIAHEGSKQDGR
jgi:U6 snRNA-associated Sm-like protein LSm2